MNISNQDDPLNEEKKKLEVELQESYKKLEEFIAQQVARGFILGLILGSSIVFIIWRMF